MMHIYLFSERTDYLVLTENEAMSCDNTISEGSQIGRVQVVLLFDSIHKKAQSRQN